MGDTEGVYMSNGGHSSSSHGIAMTYKLGELEFVFRTKSGLYWNVKYDNALEDKWYHVMVSWTNKKGLKLYINGDLVSESTTPEQRLILSHVKRYIALFFLFIFFGKRLILPILLRFLMSRHYVDLQDGDN